MFKKVLYLLKMCCLKIHFGRKISLKGVIKLSFSTKIYIKNGTVHLGKKVNSNSNLTITAFDGNVHIGDFVYFNKDCLVASKHQITIGNNTIIGPNVMIYDHDHKFNENGVTEGYSLAKVDIQNNVWIGAGCIILKGTTIGHGSVIGAGCIVKGDIPPHSLVTQERKLIITPLEKRN